MAISAVQNKSNTNTSTASIAATFDASPTQNNLMVGTVCSNDGDCTNPTGWSTAINVLNATEDDFLRISYKVAGAGESATVTFTGFVGNTKLLSISEWTGNDTSAPLDQTASTGRTTTATSISSGTTGTTSTADELAVAVAAVRDATVSAGSSNNSFTILHDLNNTVSFAGYTATRILVATGTYSTTFSWTNSATCWAAIATFKAAAAGGVTVKTLAALGVG